MKRLVDHKTSRKMGNAARAHFVDECSSAMAENVDTG